MTDYTKLRERLQYNSHVALCKDADNAIEALLGELEATRRDAARYRWAIANDDNAEQLYAIVFSCGPGAPLSIGIEIDSHIAAQADKEST